MARGGDIVEGIVLFLAMFGCFTFGLLLGSASWGLDCSNWIEMKSLQQRDDHVSAAPSLLPSACPPAGLCI